jgi:hypothetical protein
MHRRQLLIAGGSLMALSACANGPVSADSMAGEYAAGASPMTLEEEARIARAVLPAATPRAELLQPWAGPYDGVPPWDKVTPAKLREALMEGIQLNRADIAAIADNPEAPTFANTLTAMELMGAPLDRVSNVYSVMTGNIGGDDYNEALDTEVSPSCPPPATRSPSTRNCSPASRPSPTTPTRRPDRRTEADGRAQPRRLHPQRAPLDAPARPSWAGSTPPCPTPSPASARRSWPTRTPGR